MMTKAVKSVPYMQVSNCSRPPHAACNNMKSDLARANNMHPLMSLIMHLDSNLRLWRYVNNLLPT